MVLLHVLQQQKNPTVSANKADPIQAYHTERPQGLIKQILQRWPHQPLDA